MLLTVGDIKETFTQLTNGRISREEADRWACKRMHAYDSGILKFESKSDENFLWSAIQYLYGIDTMVFSGEYMHSIEEIRKTFEEKWNR